MKYSQQEIIQYVQEEDVKFIRLAFCDVFGKQKNISIMPDELQRAFSYGIAIDASAIDGFGDETHSDLFLHPEPDTLARLLSMIPVRFWKKPLKQPLKRDCNFLLVRNRNSIFSGQTTLANLP